MNLLQYRARWSSPVTCRRFIHRRWAELGGDAPADSLNFLRRCENRSWGHAIGVTMRDVDEEALVELLNNMPVGSHCQAAEDLADELGCRVSSLSSEWIEPGDVTELSNGDYLSQSEFDEHGRCCDHCGDLYLTEDGVHTVDCSDFCSESCAERRGYWYSGDGDWVCEEDEEDDDSNGLIHPYNVYLGQLVGQGNKYNLGVEIEMEFGSHSNRDSFVKELSNEFRSSIAHCKSDGSLSSRGVEVVTGYGAWCDMLPVVKRICELSLKNGGKSHKTSNCGQHVTVSRAEMSIAQQARFVVFFNHPDNQTIIREFARRNSHYGATRESKGIQAYIDQTIKSNYVPSGDKFEIVNTNHGSHLEMRACKGSLRWETVMARLALMQLVATFCESPLNANELLATELLKWVAKLDTPEATSVKEYLVYRNQESLIAV